MSTIKISRGTRFHSVIADGNPEWEVTRARGRGVWEAKCLGVDFGGTLRVFTTEQIRQSVGMEQTFARLGDENADFYASLALGQIVHYDNGFQNWVRCEVVMGTTVHNSNPHKCLKPIALCGNWQSFDLPTRRPNGEVFLGYQAGKIANGICFEPHFGSIYESGHWRGFKDSPDPKTLPAIDLSVPEMDNEAGAKAKLWKAVEDARAALDVGSDMNPKAALEAALAIIQKAL